MKYLWAVDDRGDIPAAQGLSASVKLPATITRGQAKLAYNWWPASMDLPGNSIGSDVGAIMDRLKDWVARVKGWMAIYVPPGFNGWVVLDLETFYVQQFNNNAHLMASAIEMFPDHTWAELVVLIYSGFIKEARKTWPGAKFTVFGGIGTMPDAPYQEVLRQAARDGSQLVAIMDGACPETYAAGRTFDDERRVFQDIYDQHKAAKADPAKGIAIINVRTEAGGLPAGPMVSLDGTYAALVSAWKNGYRTVAIWDAIESPQGRDTVQKWVNEVFIPAAAKLAQVVSAGTTP